MIHMVDMDGNNLIDFEGKILQVVFANSSEFKTFMRLSNFWLQVQVPGRVRFIHMNANTGSLFALLKTQILTTVPENALKSLLAGGAAGEKMSFHHLLIIFFHHLLTSS